MLSSAQCGTMPGTRWFGNRIESVLPKACLWGCYASFSSLVLARDSQVFVRRRTLATRSLVLYRGIKLTS